MFDCSLAISKRFLDFEIITFTEEKQSENKESATDDEDDEGHNGDVHNDYHDGDHDDDDDEMRWGGNETGDQSEEICNKGSGQQAPTHLIHHQASLEAQKPLFKVFGNSELAFILFSFEDIFLSPIFSKVNGVWNLSRQ